jgi:Mg2+/citrate symporter
MDERLVAVENLIADKAEHVITQVCAAMGRQGAYMQELKEALNADMTANMAREGTGVQEAVKAEVHTVNCNFDAVLVELRHLQEKQEKQENKVFWLNRVIYILLFVLWTIMCVVPSVMLGCALTVAIQQRQIDPTDERFMDVWNYVFPVVMPVAEFMRDWFLCQFMY